MKKVRVQAGEKLDDANVDKVTKMLDKIDWKKGCDILNIKYNKARFDKIIKARADSLENEKRLRKLKRRQPVTLLDKKQIIEAFLTGETPTEISRYTFRSVKVINNIINLAGVPRKETGRTYFSPPMLPEQCVAETFEIGETVWAARFQTAAEVIQYRGEGVYQIYVVEPIVYKDDLEYYQRPSVGGFYANNRVEELGSLKHLQEQGIKI